MIRPRFFAFLVLTHVAPALAAAPRAAVETPSKHLGIEIGADRTLADYRQIARYFRYLDGVSPRVAVASLGPTTLGEEMILAVISSEANLRALPRIREIAAKLADPRGLSREEIERLVDEGRAVLLVTCNIHANEIASSQMAMEWAHALATAEDRETKQRLDDVVLLLVPSLNPDGQILETDWYRKWLGTKYEGGRMPWLYHPYAGHDNNRDWFMLTQRETRALSRAIYHEWFPQVFVDEHQMGVDGPRMFIPPFSDPLDPDVHPLIWREVNLIGAQMALRLEQEGKAGLIYGYSFDAYWLGGTRNTGWWKNVTGLLLEVASARMATPVYVEPTELAGGRKGLTEYKPQVNFPHPWQGGWWRLRDIIDYERIASDALLEIVSLQRKDFLRNMAARAASAIALGARGEAYRIPAAQRDYPTARRLARLLADHNVEVHEAPDGDWWIPLAQPYSRFVSEMLEVQRYPEVRMTGAAAILPPYDVASWTLPAMMGVAVEKKRMPEEIAALVATQSRRFAPSSDMRVTGRRYAADLPAPPIPDARLYAFAAGSPESAKVVNAVLGAKREVWTTVASSAAESSFIVDRAGLAAVEPALRETRVAVTPLASRPPAARKLRAPRIALYKPWTASIDEGWTRWLLERYAFSPQTIDNGVVKKGGLAKRFDVLILPDLDKDVLDKGRPKREEAKRTYFPELPEPYRGGVGDEGAKALRAFVEEGGTMIAFASSTGWVLAELNIPVSNVLAKATREELNVPGSLLRVHVRAGHPVTSGMPAEAAVFVDDAVAFETEVPGRELERWVLASYPADARDILISGWVHGAERLVRRAAVVAVTYGKGKVVLFGFRPQNRAQTHATFPLLFHSIYWSVMDG